MFIDDIKQFIRNNPQIVMVTNRGLEDICNNVIFVAKDLDTRYPELKEMFPDRKKEQEKVEVVPSEEPVEIVEENPKPKKSKKK